MMSSQEQNLQKEYDISIMNEMKERITYGIWAFRQTLKEAVTLRITQDDSRWF